MSIEKSAAAVVLRRDVGGRAKLHQQYQVLDPQYVIGFIDGEGCFSVSIGKHQTLKRKMEVRVEFEIELRADDREILDRIQATLGCGRIYHLSYERYGWSPHVKLKVGNMTDLGERLIPFLDQYPLQAKKRFVYQYFREVVHMIRAKSHLTNQGFERILVLRDKMRQLGKKLVRNR